jgi:hypothetical protein
MKNVYARSDVKQALEFTSSNYSEVKHFVGDGFLEHPERNEVPAHVTILGRAGEQRLEVGNVIVKHQMGACEVFRAEDFEEMFFEA